MTFDDPVLLTLGAFAAVIAAIASFRRESRRRRLASFLGGPAAVRRTARSNLHRVRIERVGALAVSALLVGAAAAGPRIADPPPVAEDPPPDPPTIVIALDISASMQSGDVAPTRLARAVQVADELVEQLGNARAGLLLFASQSYWLAPPTEDLAAVRFLLAGLDAAVVSAQDPGSNLSRGIDAAVGSLAGTARGGSTRAVVLLTDGETSEPDARVAEAVEQASRVGVEVHTVGVGSSVGGEVAIPRSAFQVGGPVLAADGSPAVSRLDPTRLRSIAGRGGGTYTPADDPDAPARLARALGDAPPASPRDEDGDGVSAAILLTAGALLLLLLDGAIEVAGRRGSFGPRKSRVVIRS